MCWILFLPATTLLLGLAATGFWTAMSYLTFVALAWAQSVGLIHTQTLGPHMAAWASGLLISMVLSLAFYIMRYEQLNQANIESLLNQSQLLTSAQKQLIKAQSHKDEFIAVVSHELRTPMNSVLGFSELLHDLVQTTASKKIISHIQYSARQLLQVISDILDFSQLQANKLVLHKEFSDPQQLLVDAQARFADEALKKGIALDISISPSTKTEIYADEFRLAQVLDQLLSNALKFTESGHIQLSLEQQNDTIRIEVSDTGIGIQASQLKSIFTGFQHGSTEVQRRYGGTGLGLSICEQLVQLHHGRIGVVSQLDQGSTFWIELPIHFQEPQENTAPNQDSEIPTAKRNLLSTVLQVHLTAWLRAKAQAMPQEYEGKAYIFLTYIVLLSCGTFFYAYTAPYPEAAITNYLLCAILVMGAFLQFLGVGLRLIVNGILAYGCLHIFTLSFYSGGSMSVTSYWIALIPLAPFYLFKRTSAVFWLATPVFVQIALAYCTAHSLIPVAPVLSLNNTTWALSNLFVLTGLVLLLPLQYKLFRKHTKINIQEQNKHHFEIRKELLTQQEIKNEFIANVSHELRTPMNAIIGFNDLLKEEIADNPAALDLNLLVSQSAKHLITVIDDILDYSQLESGKLTLKHEPFDVLAVIHNAYQMFKSSGEQSSVAFHLNIGDVPQCVHGDRQRLMQMLVNLLSNAMKFTAQGEIQLSLRAHENGLLFEVSDTGSGIAAEKIQQIFGHFEQGSAAKHHRTQGHGLGLAITKRLVDAHQGRIQVRSEMNKGSCFQIWLPLQESPPPQPAQSPGQQVPDSKQTLFSILIVDDHPLNRLLVQQILQKTWPHAHLQEAENGRVALEKLKAYHFDLILMDMVMPEMDGVSATQEIRSAASDHMRRIPILGLTANANVTARQQCLDAGMNDVIFKPFTRDELVARIQGLISPDLSQAA
jgi:signal transduction histidine kinase/ActR/RegA family two-component response regulator